MSLGLPGPRDAGGPIQLRVGFRTGLIRVYFSTVPATRSRRFGPLLLRECRYRTLSACGRGWFFRCPTVVRPGVYRRLICVKFRGSPVFPTVPGGERARVQNQAGSTRTGGQRRGADVVGESFAVAWA